MPLITATKIVRFALYGPFGPILSILAAEIGKTKKKGCPEPNFSLL